MLDLPALFEQHKEEYLKDARIPPERRLHPRRDIDVFLRLHSLVPECSNMVACAEHDKIYLNIAASDLAAVATKDDIIDLIRCGLLYSDWHDGLFMFV